jgi:RNA polymerase sigma-70 factor (sigma-E family)
MERMARAGRLDPVQAVVPLAPLDGRAEVLLDRLYRAHAPGALRFALMLTGDRALSEDLVQEAFVRVAAKLGDLRDPSAFNAYLTRAVANLAKSHFRRQQVVKKHTRTVDASTLVADPVDVATSDALLVALRRLPMQQRAAVVLRYYNDLSQEEIAQVLDCPVGTVKSQLSRGLARLRKECADA